MLSMEDWVVVDTCIWASFFGKPSSREKIAVDELLDHLKTIPDKSYRLG